MKFVNEELSATLFRNYRVTLAGKKMKINEKICKKDRTSIYYINNCNKVKNRTIIYNQNEYISDISRILRRKLILLCIAEHKHNLDKYCILL